MRKLCKTTHFTVSYIILKYNGLVVDLAGIEMLSTLSTRTHYRKSFLFKHANKNSRVPDGSESVERNS